MNIEITRTAHAYAAYQDGARLGELSYSRDDHTVTAIHTEVDPQAEGRGVGGALARALLEDARANGDAVVVECPFVASYLKRHPEYEDIRAG